MMIRKIDDNDAERFVVWANQLDSENEFMLYEPGERNWTVEEIRERIKRIDDKNRLMLIAEKDSKIVGSLSAEKGFTRRIMHSAYVSIGILKDYESMGIGTKLFEELEKWALENNIKRLELTVMVNNEKAMGLYKKFGFKVEGTKEKSIKIRGKYIDEYYMGKIL